MKIHALILLLLFTMVLNGTAEQRLPELVLLTSGDEGHFCWSLYQQPSEETNLDLVLVIKNTGTKHIPLEGLSSSHIALQDSNGRSLKIWRATGFDSIGYRSITVGHIYVQGPYSDKTPYSLGVDYRSPVPEVRTKFQTGAFSLNPRKSLKE